VNRTNNPASDIGPTWSPDGTQIAFRSTRTGSNGGSDIWKINFDGSGSPTDVGITYPENLPAWSPDGRFIVRALTVSGQDQLYAIPSDGNTNNIVTIDVPPAGKNDANPDWQPVRTYARPKGATPIYLSLVPAYKQCTSPNATHPAPLPGGECVPPVPESSYLTVGTPNFNGQGANSIGYVRMKVVAGSPDDQLEMTVSDTDVRCQRASGGCTDALTDYTGSLRFDTMFRITDMANGGGTVLDTGFNFSVPCVTTTSTTVGSTCSITATAAALVPRGQRTMWQLAARDQDLRRRRGRRWQHRPQHAIRARRFVLPLSRYLVQHLGPRVSRPSAGSPTASRTREPPSLRSRSPTGPMTKPI
jgi:hypothetical protein